MTTDSDADWLMKSVTGVFSLALLTFSPSYNLLSVKCSMSINSMIVYGLWCLTSLSTIFQLYRGGQFFLVEETGMLGENHRKSLIKLYHIMLYRLSRIQTHNVIGTDCIGNCESNYHIIKTTTHSQFNEDIMKLSKISNNMFCNVYKWHCTCRVRVMVFNSAVNNISIISWQSALLVEEIRVPGENRQPAASHQQTLSHIVISSRPRHEWDSNSQLYMKFSI